MNGQPAPLGLLAELTHRCPLRCPYCSNPIELERRSAELHTAVWLRVFDEAAALGVLHLHLSGGEPLARRDLLDLARGASRAGLYTNLITSGIGLDGLMAQRLAEAGLDHVQISVQDVEAEEADRVAGRTGSHASKRNAARAVVAAGLPLTVNVVIHRGNVERTEALIAEAAALGARRVEIAHAQYYGWALRNRAALLPSRSQAEAAREAVRRARVRLAGVMVIDYVAPDYFARFPKACMNGWGRQSLNVTPSGKVLPCHAAETLPGLVFWTVRDRSLRDIWESSPAFQAYRGTAWMAEACASCPHKGVDFGGCRCQAFALTGEARNTDPACELSPRHAALRELTTGTGEAGLVYRGFERC